MMDKEWKPSSQYLAYITELSDFVLQNFVLLIYSILHAAAAAAKSLQPCLTLCDPIDGSPPGSPIPGILLARTLEWVAISFSYAWKWKLKVKSLSHVWLLATPWTTALQAPLPMGFSRQEYWSRVPLPSLTHLLEWKANKKQNLSIPSADKDVEQLEITHRWWECKTLQSLWETTGGSLQFQIFP